MISETCFLRRIVPRKTERNGFPSHNEKKYILSPLAEDILSTYHFNLGHTQDKKRDVLKRALHEAGFFGIDYAVFDPLENRLDREDRLLISLDTPFEDRFEEFMYALSGACNKAWFHYLQNPTHIDDALTHFKRKNEDGSGHYRQDCVFGVKCRNGRFSRTYC